MPYMRYIIAVYYAKYPSFGISRKFGSHAQNKHYNSGVEEQIHNLSCQTELREFCFVRFFGVKGAPTAGSFHTHNWHDLR